MVWNPVSDSPEIVRIHNIVAKLDHAKCEIVSARFFEIPGEAVDLMGKSEIPGRT